MTDFLGRLQAALRRVLPDDVVLVVDLPTEPVSAIVDAAGSNAPCTTWCSTRAMRCRAAARSRVSCHHEQSQRRRARRRRRRLRRRARGRYGARHGRGDARAHLRSVLHHQGRTRRHRPRAWPPSTRSPRTRGGHVDVTSTPEHGTTFTLWLPEHVGLVAPVDNETTDGAHGRDSRPGTSAGGRGPRRRARQRRADARHARLQGGRGRERRHGARAAGQRRRL